MASARAAPPSPRPAKVRRDRVEKGRRVKWQQWPEITCPLDDLDKQSLSCSHPDLEDGSLIAWGLRQSELSTGDKVEVDVLYGSGTDLKWDRILKDEELERIVQLPKCALRVFFVNTLNSDSSWLPGNFSPRRETIRLLRVAGLSGVLLCNLYSEDSYWAKMGNQRYLHYDGDGQMDSFEICYQYRCGWDTGVSFIHAIRTKDSTTYFCINYPSGARDRLEAIFRHKERRAVLHRDFFFDTLAADDGLKQWQFDIGERRLKLLALEKKFEKPTSGEINEEPVTEQIAQYSCEPSDVKENALKLRQKQQLNDIEKQSSDRGQKEQKGRIDALHGQQSNKQSGPTRVKKEEEEFDIATRDLHKMVRHWLGLRQDCEDLLAQLKFLKDTHVKVSELGASKWSTDRTADAGESFDALISQCDICMRWTQVYHDRTNTRIQLLFHLANQRMAIVNQEMAKANQKTALDTTTIAEQTAQDSASMITLAAVTMVFLPGTFVCTIVSTNFFDFGERGLQVSGRWWVLLVVGVPLTLAVFGVWWQWREKRLKEQEEKRQKQREAYERLNS